MQSAPSYPFVCTVVSPVGDTTTSMIRAIGFLHLGELTFQTNDALLGLLNSVEGALEPRHPSSQCGALPLQTRAEFLQSELLAAIKCGRSSRANDAAAWRGHAP